MRTADTAGALGRREVLQQALRPGARAKEPRQAAGQGEQERPEGQDLRGLLSRAVLNFFPGSFDILSDTLHGVTSGEDAEANKSNGRHDGDHRELARQG